MKSSINRWSVTALTLCLGLVGFRASATENDCIEGGPHATATCAQEGFLSSIGSLSYTELNTLTNWPVDPPILVTTPIFADGKVAVHVTYDCVANQWQNSWYTNSVHYVVDALTFTPAFTNGTVYTNISTNTYTASIQGKPTSLMAWWPAEGNANDVLGGNSATLINNPSYTAGKVGQAFSFAGSNCARITYSKSLISANITVETWVKPNTQASGQTLIFGQAYGFCQLVTLPGTNGLKVEFRIAAPSGAFPGVAATNEIPIGSYSHLAGTWDGTSLKVYINGVLRGQATPGSSPIDSAFGFYVGGFYVTGAGAYSGQYFSGAIDELSLYHCALSSGDILAIYNAGGTGKQWASLPASCYCTSTLTTNIATVLVRSYGVGSTNDTDGDGLSDYMEVLMGRNPYTSGTVADTNNATRLQVYTPLK